MKIIDVNTGLTVEMLRSVLNYDQVTGYFFWKNTSRKDLLGKRAGHVSKKGYRWIKINGFTYSEGRLAYLYVNGAWPTYEVDHCNTIKHKNSVNNIRDATRSQNCANKQVRSDSKTGIKGVGVSVNGTYCARLWVNGKCVLQKRFKTEKAAQQAYIDASNKYFGEFARAYR